jgi:chromosome segregation ATPase
MSELTKITPEKRIAFRNFCIEKLEQEIAELKAEKEKRDEEAKWQQLRLASTESNNRTKKVVIRRLRHKFERKCIETNQLKAELATKKRQIVELNVEKQISEFADTVIDSANASLLAENKELKKKLEGCQAYILQLEDDAQEDLHHYLNHLQKIIELCLELQDKDSKIAELEHLLAAKDAEIDILDGRLDNAEGKLKYALSPNGNIVVLGRKPTFID